MAMPQKITNAIQDFLKQAVKNSSQYARDEIIKIVVNIYSNTFGIIHST
jgi:hypothetical protein